MTAIRGTAGRWLAGVLGLLLSGAVSGCVQDSAEPGPFNSPSELGLALTLTASPDVLPLDGVAQSLIRIVARDANGQSVSGLSLLLQIASDTGLADLGQLSNREVTTGSDGRAAATYTVPPKNTSGAASDGGEVVTIWVTPIGDNFDNSTTRSLSVRLVPAGAVIPPFSVTAGFTFTPDAPKAFDPVLFTTACASTLQQNCVVDPLGLVSSYLWSFGDGRSGSGPTASNSYDGAGTYLVTLTVKDANGRSAEVTRSLVVGAGTPPTAVITASPTDPLVNAPVFFNASASTAAAGRVLVAYAWDFGDGGSSSGAAPSHRYDAAGTYVVTLTVRDDKGQAGTATAQIVVQ